MALAARIESLDVSLAPPPARVIINAFHHFPPALAQQVLVGMAKDAPGVFISEGLVRNPLSFLSMTAWGIPALMAEPLLAHEPFHAAVRAATPLRRVGEPHEVACTVAFLAMDAAAYITGQVVGIDGGMMQVGFKYTGE
jgi:hypothetical protein